MDVVFEEPNEPHFEDLWDKITKHDKIGDSITLSDFINADQELATTGTRTLEEIAQSCSSIDPQNNDESDDEINEIEQPNIEPISRQKAYIGFNQLRQYVQENAVDPKLMQACHLFEDFLYQEQVKKSTQPQITQFLK